MRCVYIYIDTSHRGDIHVKASVKDINNLKCRHHFGRIKLEAGLGSSKKIGVELVTQTFLPILKQR